MGESESEYCAKKANKVLVGATILRVEARDDPDYGVVLNLVVRLADGTEAEVGVSQDPEGNGPGWLEVSHLVER